MKNNFGNCQSHNKIEVTAVCLWMGMQLGEGELEITNQGRLRSKNSICFSQGTVAIGQLTPRIGVVRPKQRVLSAGCACDSDSTSPISFLHNHNHNHNYQLLDGNIAA